MFACRTRPSGGSAASKDPIVPDVVSGVGLCVCAVGCDFRRWAPRLAGCYGGGRDDAFSSPRAVLRCYPSLRRCPECRCVCPYLYGAVYFRDARNKWRGVDVAPDVHVTYCGNADGHRGIAILRWWCPHGRGRRHVSAVCERRSPGWWRSDRRSMSCPICYPATNLLTFRVTNDGTRRIR